MLEFSTAQINNDHTRVAYLNATKRFAESSERNGIHELVDVGPIHIAAFVKDLRWRAGLTVEQIPKPPYGDENQIADGSCGISFEGSKIARRIDR